MEPSSASTSSTRWRCLEAGVLTLFRLRSCALRMRVIMSPMGSLTAICSSLPLPARLDEAGDQAGGTQLAQGDPAHLQLAIVGPRTAGHIAAVANAHGSAVARHLG